MKKNIIFLLVFLVYSNINSQVGIGTTAPKSTLDVNGSLTLRNELRVGGTKTTDGNPGAVNQILVSQGDNVTPAWKNSKLGFYELDEYRITSSDAKSNETGIDFGSAVINPIYPTSSLEDDIAGSASTPAWTEIPFSQTTFKVANVVNKIDFVFQTGVEMSNTSTTADQFVRYACGIFVDNKLKAVRADQINGIVGKGEKNQAIFTLKYVISNLPLKAPDIVTGIRPAYTAKVACRRITSSTPGYFFSIGRTTTDGNQVANNFMMKSVFKLDVSEQVKIIY